MKYTFRRSTLKPSKKPMKRGNLRTSRTLALKTVKADGPTGTPDKPQGTQRAGNSLLRTPRHALRERHGKPRKRLRAKPDPELRSWSKAVRERDNYTCRMTGIRDVNRNVAHHVAPRSRRPDLRLDVDNGITLTPEAHQRVHDNPVWAMKAGWLSSETYEAARKRGT